MRQLYGGRIDPKSCAVARTELRALRTELAKLPPDAVVWDFENPVLAPPWGSNIAPTIRSLDDYFVTSDGRNLLDALDDALREAERTGEPVTVGG